MFVSAVFLCLTGCDGDKASLPPLPPQAAPATGIRSAELPVPVSAADAAPQFTRLAAETTGIDFISPIVADHSRSYLYQSGFLCGGVAIGDADGDGRPDVLLVNGPGENRLYRQIGTWKFENITSKAGVGGGDAWGAGAAMVDIDNDGDLDIYICNYDAANQLYINDGQGVFEERAKAYGLDLVDACLQPAFCDYDNDGDLDLYVLTYRYYYPQGVPPELRDVRGLSLAEVRSRVERFGKYFGLIAPGTGKTSLRPVGRPDRLLRNEGNGTFSDVSQTAGVDQKGFGLSATWWDYNGDGLTDLYVANDFNDPDRLYRNNGDGTFTDVIADAVPHTSNTSMGSDVGDLNNDGRFDFIVTDMSATTHFMQKTTMGAMGSGLDEMLRLRPQQYMRNAIFLHSGTDRFMEMAYMAGMAGTDWTWAVKIADFDNDGFNDAFFTNGITRSFNDSDRGPSPQELLTKTEWQVYADTKPRREMNLAFRNRGDLTFESVGKGWGLDHVGISVAAAYGDLDGDGDLDLIVANCDEPVHLYRNNTSMSHRVTIRLEGSRSNRLGIGAVVRIETPSGLQVRQMNPMTGFVSCNESLIHFGLGADTIINKLSVRWPDGQEQVFEKLQADRGYTITEPAGETKPVPPSLAAAPMFASTETLNLLASAETPFDDFKRQPLLPSQLSQLGPGMAWGDVDGDGDDDVFIGGSAGRVGQLALNMGNGLFERAYFVALDADAASEDMAPLFVDADGDGDLDLYVASGGIECEPDDPALRDRLYLNDGTGRFTKAADALPDLRDSSGGVVAGDFDGDGDLDLFIGGRSIPGEYPRTPNSRLLRNDGGKFTDVTEQVAPGLMKAGLVTSALWTDVNGDGRIDLLLTCEWGPVRLWQNQGGMLAEQPERAGLAERLGWWNGIAGADIDGDGDIDYVVTNVGLNTKYHASPAHPLLLYYGDLDGTGNANIVEAEFEGSICYPMRGKSCSTQAMPSLAERFPTYKKFALASIEELYTETRLKNALRFEANDLRSGVLINDGSGRFEFRALPNIVQIAPVFGVLLTELDGDGRVDLVIAQNFYTPQPETGRMDGGLSLVLRGNGDGTFAPMWPNESGIVVPGDSKSLTQADLNGDNRPDLVFGINSAPVRAFTHQSAGTHRLIKVTLRGKAPNPQAVGARITCTNAGGTAQTREVSAGGGYLSQSGAAIYFAAPSDRAATLTVRWPEGHDSVHELDGAAISSGRIVISQP